MMTCDQKILQLISCYADGETTPEESKQAAEHLEKCAGCRKMLNEWREQRQLLEWAYTLKLPDEIGIDISGQEKYMNTVSVVSDKPCHIHWSFRWAFAGVIAIIMAFVIYHFAMLPPFFDKNIATGHSIEKTRVANGITLEVGPDSTITRLGERSIKLDRGWVKAFVRHGDGFQIFTRRMRIEDKGTVFNVATSRDIDCVTVEEGIVTVENSGKTHEVKAGEAAIARDGMKLAVNSFPASDEEENEKGSLIGESKTKYEPKNSDDLDMEEGLRALAQRFPDAREISSTEGFSSISSSDTATRYYLQLRHTPLLRNNLRKHYLEIAQAMAGKPIDQDWEIPVEYILIGGTVKPFKLPAGVYYIRIISTNGKVVWRLSDAEGNDADIPISWSKYDGKSNGTASYGSSGSIACSTYSRTGQPIEITMQLLDWPGEYKPSLTLSLQGASISDYRQTENKIIAQVENAAASIRGFKISDFRYPYILYLNPNRTRRIIVIWNNNAGKDLCRLINQVKHGNRGSVILGAMATDEDLLEPNVKAGAYLLKFVISSMSAPPHIEFVANNGNKWKLNNSDTDSYGSAWTPDSLPGYGKVKLSYSYLNSHKPGFTFEFKVIGRPDDLSTRDIRKGTETTWKEPTKVWASGCIRIRKP